MVNSPSTLTGTRGFYLRCRDQVDRIFDALTDPARSERTILLVLGGYVLAWWLYAVIAQSSQDVHIDMAEMADWSREAGLGTPKHPPLGPWLVGVWFKVFPREDWSYYLFALLFPTAALWIAWRLAARFLPSEKRLVAVALLSLIPFYNFHALKYNANSVLTPLWAATTWWFLRSLETRSLGSAILTGVAGAAAMLGKYWSVLLIAALALAALTDRRRESYFGSPAPYVALAVGTILLTPHIDWLVRNHFVSFDYAIETHAATFPLALTSVVEFLGGSILYLAVPILATLLAAKPGKAAIADTVWPSEPERRTLIVIFVVPFVLAIAIALLLSADIHPLWMMCAVTLFPIILLASPRMTVPHHAAVGILSIALIVPIAAVVASPLIALYNQIHGVPDDRADYRLVARAVQRVWSAHTDKPLRILGGTTLLDGVAFYLDIPPATFNIDFPDQTPWVGDDRIRDQGLAVVCVTTDPFCMRELEGFADHYHAIARQPIDISRSFLGISGTAAKFEIAVVPPE
jgi:4-amino-4-deoxy-L-arabinose transferase-like glycosyltransferase